MKYVHATLFDRFKDLAANQVFMDQQLQALGSRIQHKDEIKTTKEQEEKGYNASSTTRERNRDW